MVSLLISMSVFALVGAITPGPVNIIATSSGASFGFARTLPHVLGATSAYTIIVVLVGGGLSQLLKDLPIITEVLKYLGSIFLLYMAFKIATSVSDNRDETFQTPPSFIEGALCQGLNPKAWLVSMSGVSLFVLSQNNPAFYLTAYALLSFMLCFVGVGVWAGLGHLIRDYLQQAERQVRSNQLMGILLSFTVISIWVY